MNTQRALVMACHIYTSTLEKVKKQRKWHPLPILSPSHPKILKGREWQAITGEFFLLSCLLAGKLLLAVFRRLVHNLVDTVEWHAKLCSIIICMFIAHLHCDCFIRYYNIIYPAFQGRMQDRVRHNINKKQKIFSEKQKWFRDGLSYSTPQKS